MSGTLRLRGATSGYSELQAPAVAADQTFVLPTAGGTLLTTDSPVPQLTLELGSASEPSLRFEGDTDTGLFSEGTNTLNLVTGGSSKVVIGAAAHTIYAGTGASVRAVDIDNGGRVIIGGTNSIQVDSVNNSFQIQGTNKANGRISIQRESDNGLGAGIYLAKSRSSGFGIVQDNDEVGIIAFNPADGTNYDGQSASIQCFIDGTPGADDIPGRLTFATTADGSAAPTERMRIDSSGNIGIGDSAPSEKLNVAGNVMLEGGDQYLYLTNAGTGNSGIYVRGNTSGSYLRSHSTGIFTWEVTGSEKMRLDSSGALNLRSDGGVGNNTRAKLIGGYQAGGSNYGGYFAIETTTSSNVKTERLRIDSSGNVGIGTTSPSAPLAFADTAGTAGDPNKISLYSSGGTPIYGFGISASQLDYISGGSHVFFSRSGTTSTERARIDSSGRLLVGTTTSSEIYLSESALQIYGTTYPTASLSLFRNSSSTAADASGIFFARSRAGKTSVVNNDRIAFLSFNGFTGTTANTPAAEISASVDGTPGANDMPGRLVFSTTADGASSPTERMRITSNSDGHLLIANTNPANSSDTGIKLKGGSASTVDVVINAATNINLNHVYNTNATNNGYRYYLSADGGIRNFSSNNSNLCDEREKKNIAALEDKWDKVKSWELKKFHYIGEPDTDDLRYGVIAQQVETECPEVLTSWLKQEAREAQLDEDGNVVTPAQEQILRKGVKEQQMMWMAIKALQEAQTRIETLEANNLSLENRIAALENN